MLQVEDRYQLTGDVLDGQMDLDILNVRRTDNGPYCCRVDIDGIFNDKKVIMNLRVVKGKLDSTPPLPAQLKGRFTIIYKILSQIRSQIPI